MDCYACKKPIIPSRDRVYHHLSYKDNIKVPMHMSCHLDVHKTDKYPHLRPVDNKRTVESKKKIYLKYKGHTFYARGKPANLTKFKIKGLCAINRQTESKYEGKEIYIKLPRSWINCDVVVILLGKNNNEEKSTVILNDKSDKISEINERIEKRIDSINKTQERIIEHINKRPELN